MKNRLAVDEENRKCYLTLFFLEECPIASSTKLLSPFIQVLNAYL